MAKTLGRPLTLKGRREKADVSARLRALGCDPITGMAKIALGELKCNVCRGKLKTKYRLEPGQHTADCARQINRDLKASREVKCFCGHVGERVCESCYGSGYEIVSPELRGKMFAELAQYEHPKLKAIEVSGSLDTPDLAAVLRERFRKHEGAKEAGNG